jgi:hypothetical protein
LVYVIAIWYILWSFGQCFSNLVDYTKENLATQDNNAFPLGVWRLIKITLSEGEKKRRRRFPVSFEAHTGNGKVHTGNGKAHTGNGKAHTGNGKAHRSSKSKPG